ncbi:MAG: hypothetical protein ACFE95_16565, partial [Candidatus Hodarchaeota archaeon]
MKLIEFPSELVVFSNRIDSHWQTKLRTILSEKQARISELTLKDWYSELKVILSSEEKLPSTLWAIAAKLAWLQADVSFFIDHSDVIKEVRDEPLFLCYFGAGISEFLDLKKGLDLIEEGISHLESSQDSHALFDISIPYILILNNSNNKDSLRKFYHKIDQLFEEKKSEIEFNYHQLITTFNCCKIFALEKKSEKENLKETLQIALKNQHHLIAGLVYSSLAKWEEEFSYQKNMEACMEQYQIINARLRTIIAYTNYAHFLSSKARYEESSRYLSKAFKLAEKIIKSPEDGPGLYIYPLTQKAWMQIEQGKLNEALETLQLALGNAKNYNSNYYQIKIEYGIAYVFFLLMKYDLSLNHAENALSLTEKLPTKQLQCTYRLEYADILTDLNKFNEVENILKTIDPNDLEGCSKVQYDYVKGKLELNRHNLGTSKHHFERAINNIEKCSHLKPLLLFTLSEEYIREFRLSEDPKILQEAQEMIEEGLKGIHDVPTLTKGKIISAILLSAQDRHEEAEEILESLISP